MAERTGRRGGAKNAVATGIMMLLIAAALLGWVRVNNISSPSDVYQYFRGLSDKVQECGIRTLSWNCDVPFSGDDQNTAPTPSPSPSTATPGTGTPTSTLTPSSPPEKLLEALNKVQASEPLPKEYQTKFVRSEWQYWLGSPCTVRADFMREKGSEVTLVEGSRCNPATGKWTSPFTNEVIENPFDVGVTQVVTPQYAADHGGAAWDLKKKEAFANDSTQLEIISSEERENRGSMGPDEYMPSEEGYSCQYAKTWTYVLDKYSLTATEASKDTLREALGQCG